MFFSCYSYPRCPLPLPSKVIIINMRALYQSAICKYSFLKLVVTLKVLKCTTCTNTDLLLIIVHLYFELITIAIIYILNIFVLHLQNMCKDMSERSFKHFCNRHGQSQIILWASSSTACPTSKRDFGPQPLSFCQIML